MSFATDLPRDVTLLSFYHVVVVPCLLRLMVPGIELI